MRAADTEALSTKTQEAKDWRSAYEAERISKEFLSKAPHEPEAF